MLLRNSILIVLTFLFINPASAQEKKIIDQVVAIVGKQVILQSDIENQALQLRAQGYYTSGDITCEVFEEMLYAKLLVNQAILDSVEVSDAEVKS